LNLFKLLTKTSILHSLNKKGYNGKVSFFIKGRKTIKFYTTEHKYGIIRKREIKMTA
jgi:hypothetical protein